MRLSYSMYSTYAKCPLVYKFKYLMGIKEPFKADAASRGTEIHNDIEAYIRGHRDYLPWHPTKGVKGVPRLGDEHPLQGVVDKLRHWPNGDKHVEKKIYFDIDWTPFALDKDEAAYTVVFDAVGVKDGVVEIAEWKSGKPYDEHGDQRLLYALAGLRIWLPKKVVVTTYYVDMTSPAKRTTVPEAAEQELRDMWSGRRETIINDTLLSPRPSDKCRWCFYRKSNGGPCPLNL